jgi:hypothetical protein
VPARATGSIGPSHVTAMAHTALAAYLPRGDAHAMDHSSSSSPRIRPTDLPLLILTGLGFPLSQLAIKVMGRKGAALVETVAGALLVRDAQLLSTGSAGRSRPVPAALLYLEIGVACIALALGLCSLTSHGVREATSRKPGPWETARRIALGTLFGLHTWRFAIRRGPG